MYGVTGRVHGADHSGDFLGGFATSAEEGEEGGDLAGWGVGGEDLGEGVVGFGGGEMAVAGDESFDVWFEGHVVVLYETGCGS